MRPAAFCCRPTEGNPPDRDRRVSSPRACAHGLAAGAVRSGAILLVVDNDDIVIGASRGARHVLGLTDDDIARGVVASDLVEMQADTLDSAEY